MRPNYGDCISCGYYQGEHYCGYWHYGCDPDALGCDEYINKEDYKMKLINAEAFLAERKNALKNNGVYKMMEKWVEAAPDAQAQGEWIKRGKTTVCSVCGGKAKSLPYCGWCGAKMKVEVETQ